MPYKPLAAQVRRMLNDSYDTDVALAMMNQARIRHGSPILPEQVIHLIQIGYRAGWNGCVAAIKAGRPA